ncbi:MAG: hypothetical protein HQK76_07930 [Desulfobacterales bacterium]|nr:hypothetical protein [Desulfobacterales bacterium]
MRILYCCCFVIIFSFTVIIGCGSLVSFNDEYRNIIDNQLPLVQFYISHPLRLTREVDLDEKAVSQKNHSVKIGNTKKIIEIIIPKNTPGILKKIEKDTLYIQFEDISDDKERVIPFKKRILVDGLNDPSNFIYEFSDEKVVYGGDIYKTKFIQRDLLVEEKDVSIFTGDSEKKIEHYTPKYIYPVLKFRLYEYDKFMKEKRKVTGIKLSTE